MTEERRRIVRTDFTPAKMLAMSDEEARRYFLASFFVPIVYNLMEEHEDNYRGTYFVLHFCKVLPGAAQDPADEGAMFPVISNVSLQANNRGIFPDQGVYPAGLTGNELATQRGRTFGQPFTVQEISEALRHAFPKTAERTLALTHPRTLLNCPLVACVKVNSTEKLQLTVLCKEKVGEASAYIQAMTRGGTTVLHATYGRHYNVLTGEWLDLCDEADCNRCKLVRESVLAQSAFGPPPQPVEQVAPIQQLADVLDPPEPAPVMPWDDDAEEDD